MELTVGDEPELDLLGTEPGAAGKDGPFAEDEAREVAVVGLVVRCAHGRAGKKMRPGCVASLPESLVRIWENWHASGRRRVSASAGAQPEWCRPKAPLLRPPYWSPENTAT